MDTNVRAALLTSRIYWGLLSVLILLSILSLWLLPFSAAWRWLACLSIAIAAIWWVFKSGPQAGLSCLTLACDEHGYVILGMRDGTQLTGEVAADTLVAPWLILLNVKTDGQGKLSLLLFPDAMDSDHYRRLRVLLRHSR